MRLACELCPEMLLFCAAILLSALWGVIGMISASRRPPYTFADWQNASDRIGREILRLRSATSAASDRGTYRRLPQRPACQYRLHPQLGQQCPPPSPYAGSALLRPRRSHPAGRLLLRLCFVRLQLFLPHSAAAVHRHALTDAESYISLCFALTGFLEHYVY